ncbi:hypothetical protein [Congregibacter sp.]|uniref:hypothetical protein n=1 Tax=Congregibacter sp. TaxID=2744308 RepID=UPI003F6CAB25
MKTVIVHLGTHKAASTSIQLFLAHNRDRLEEMGLCYPEAPPPTGFAHHGLAWTIIRRYTKLERRPANYSLEDAIQAFENTDCDTLMLSSEDFLTTAFYEGFLDEFFMDLRKTFDRVVVCAYVRSRKDFFNSSYNQWVKSLSYSKNFDRYIDQVLSGLQAPMHYTKSLSDWADRSDSAMFLPFHTKTFGDHPEKYLLNQLGFSGEAIDRLDPLPFGAVNASIGTKAIVAFRKLSSLLHDQDWYDHYSLAKREVLLHELEAKAEKLGWNDDKFRALSEQQAARVKHVFSQDDDQFAENFWNTRWSLSFPQDEKIDLPSELEYGALDNALRSEIDQFVSEGYSRAEEIYKESSDAPSIEPLTSP